MSNSLCEVEIKDIDLLDLRYKISLSEPDISNLIQSIKSTGLIVPPILKPVDDQYIIISGFNRIKALIANETKHVEALICPESCSDAQCLVKSIICLSYQRQLTHAELIKSINLLSDFFSLQELVDHSIVYFNMQLNKKYMVTLLKIAHLPEPAINLLHDKKISLKTAGKISEMNQESQHWYLKIFSEVKASNSVQLEIITNMFEICARDKISVKNLLEKIEIKNILYDKTSDQSEKSSNLRGALFQIRYPSIYNANKRKKKEIELLKPYKGIKFLPSDNYEANELTVSFKISSYDDAKNKFKNIQNCLDEKTLKEIFD